MASPTTPTTTVVDHDAQEAHTSPEQMAETLETFFRSISQLSGEDGCKFIVAILQQNKVLCQEKEKLEKQLDAYDENLERIAEKIKVSNKDRDSANDELELVKEERDSRLAERDEVREQVARLESEIRANTEEITNTLNSKLDTEQKLNAKEQENNDQAAKLGEMDEDLRRTQEELERLQQTHNRDYGELADLRSKVVSLRVVPKSESTALLEKIHSIFEMAHALAYHFFGRSDLDRHVLGGKELQALEGDERLAGIPLVPTNSEVAKRMRVASVLRLLALSALEHIFQPVYLTECGTELSEIIENLYRSNSEDAAWFRSVCLHITPEIQAKNAYERARAVIEEVVECVDFLLQPAGTSDQFRTALQKWCEETIQIWRDLQQLELAFHCSFEEEDQDLQARVCTVLPESPSKREEPKETNGGSPTGSGQPNGQNKKQPLGPSDIAAQVWPAVLATKKDGHVKLARQGYVLTKLQVQTAREEAVPTRPLNRIRRSFRRHDKPRPVMSLSNNSSTFL